MTTILLIEDNDNNISLVEDIFIFDGIPANLVVATSGEEAIRRAVEIQPALILMDLRLPGIDGMETTQLLKCNPLTRTIPIWAVTAFAMKGDEERARSAGCSEYITKPILGGELADKLRFFLDPSKKRKGVSVAAKMGASFAAEWEPVTQASIKRKYGFLFSVPFGTTHRLEYALRRESGSLFSRAQHSEIKWPSGWPPQVGLDSRLTNESRWELTERCAKTVAKTVH